MEILPAIDLRGGRCVRLVQGDYANETVYSEDPADMARSFADAGAKWLHVVDLDGAREGEPRNAEAIRAILAASGSMAVELGGGIRTASYAETLLEELGLDRVILGTIALEDPDLVRALVTRFGRRVALGVDARAGAVATRGWRETGTTTVDDVVERFEGLDLGAIIYTDIGRDGMLEGPNVAATERLARSTPIPVIASGGVSSVDDLVCLARTRVIAGAIVGKALYTGAVELSQAVEAVAAC